MVQGLRWDLLTIKEGPSGGLSTAAAVEGKIWESGGDSLERRCPVLGGHKVLCGGFL
jgi:hypothetical protein